MLGRHIKILPPNVVLTIFPTLFPNSSIYHAGSLTHQNILKHTRLPNIVPWCTLFLLSTATCPSLPDKCYWPLCIKIIFMSMKPSPTFPFPSTIKYCCFYVPMATHASLHYSTYHVAVIICLSRPLVRSLELRTHDRFVCPVSSIVGD